mmetsp:Transcript_19141/g.53368  ORF Transcript_19141/g.53368 Transcript_19141/m.53368 type:complete len:161 (+) Transcript_19141:134-616(+)|eukprot:CAMPEP_0117652844 /NCGR_PEP_ID=MMETSP0804-20121206/2854_1 /TAXON_ID=1074897 /ORGANISM="Tetraselmis astigmatica, Strain CCMP880" /LENGTH=160 /DNA_ID=CAMNT_0005458939 /DNA_START=97 /DNA_END=579 /DNA_ORIENTATION=-
MSASQLSKTSIGLGGVHLKPRSSRRVSTSRGSLVCNAGKPVNVLKRVEQKKILSTVESVGLLSKLDQAGVSLKKIESLGLLSAAEKLGALSLLENVVEAEPLQISALAIPCFAFALAIQIIIPGDNLGEVALKILLTAASGAGFVTFMVGGAVVSYLQQD